MRRLSLSAAGVAVVAAASMLSALPAHAATRPTGPLTLTSGAFLGAMTNPNRATNDGTPTEVAALESTMGRTMGISHRFYPWTEVVTGRWERADVRAGRTPMLTWGAGSDTKELTSGIYDDFIRQQARGMKSIGAPVFLRFYHEMEGSYRIPHVHSAADFVAAWKHVHDLFVAEGATNVQWVWCPMAWSYTTVSNPSAYYPGADYVDWVAADGYNWNPTQPNSPWRSFKTIFANWYKWAATTGKPLMVAEFGTGEDPVDPNRKANWLRDSLKAMKTDFPLIQGATYFDTLYPKGGINYPWQLNSSSASMNAWAEISKDPYLAGMPTSPTNVADVPAPFNLSGNPGFEPSLAGWSKKVGGATVLARDTSTKQAGNASMKVTNSGTTAIRSGFSDSPGFVTATVAGQQYRVTIAMTSSVANQGVSLNLREYSGSTTIGQATASKKVVTAGTWTTLTTTYTATKDDSLMAITISGTLPAGASFWVDQVAISGA